MGDAADIFAQARQMADIRGEQFAIPSPDKAVETKAYCEIMDAAYDYAMRLLLEPAAFRRYHRRRPA